MALWSSKDEQKECEGCSHDFHAHKHKCEDCLKYTVCNRHQCHYCQNCDEYKENHY